MNLFEEKKYLHLKGFLDKDNCAELTKLMIDETKSRGWKDTQCPKSISIRDSATFDKLLVDLLPHFEQHAGKKLLPTYAYARYYVPGEVLKVHRDRPACEISASLTLGFDGDVWPFWAGMPSTEEDGGVKYKAEHDEDVYIKNPTPIRMEAGDAILYHGQEVFHWREEYKEGKWQCQVFLHYVDANGPNKEWIYDKRQGLAWDKEDRTLRYWLYDDVLSAKDCEMLVKLYNTAPDEEAGVGGGNTNKVDKSIRNVNRVILPVYKGIGARLAAVGLDANRQRWQFDITHANQSEFLKYPTGGGRYKGHVDTFMEKGHPECRKLTVLAFLNDNFKGGKFFLQDSHEKFYPPQKAGTVLVFPSFMLHGVEDVEEGERYSVVCWMVGPWFR
jgi:predicted 2-oxoglutarate/Fe(II)-dependent dioxygenase YbiX